MTHQEIEQGRESKRGGQTIMYGVNEPISMAPFLICKPKRSSLIVNTKGGCVFF